jgi:hypothetical protein
MGVVESMGINDETVNRIMHDDFFCGVGLDPFLHPQAFTVAAHLAV